MRIEPISLAFCRCKYKIIFSKCENDHLIPDEIIIGESTDRQGYTLFKPSTEDSDKVLTVKCLVEIEEILDTNENKNNFLSH